MTLVVARKFDSEIRIVCDGKISYPDELNKGPLHGALKSVIIDNNNCICYAGSFNISIDAIRYLLNNNISDYTLIKDYLLSVNIKNNKQADFVVGNTIGSMNLCKISNGKAEDIGSSTWIGDYKAFEKFQEYYHKKQIKEEIEEKLLIYARMVSAMAELVREGSCPSVGDFYIGIRSGPKGFNYLENANAFCVRQTISPNTLTAIRFGSAAEGGYAFSILTPNKTGIGAIGIHYTQGNLGALFYPLISDKAIIYRNVNYDGFTLKVKEDYEITLSGIKIG